METKNKRTEVISLLSLKRGWNLSSTVIMCVPLNKNTIQSLWHLYFPQRCWQFNSLNTWTMSVTNTATEISWGELSCLSCVTLWPRPEWNFEPIGSLGACAVCPRGIERTHKQKRCDSTAVFTVSAQFLDNYSHNRTKYKVGRIYNDVLVSRGAATFIFIRWFHVKTVHFVEEAYIISSWYSHKQ